MKISDLKIRKLFEAELNPAEQQFVDQDAAEVIHSRDKLEIFKILTYDAARFFAKEAKWPFLKSEELFNTINNSGPIYYIRSPNHANSTIAFYNIRQGRNIPLFEFRGMENKKQTTYDQAVILDSPKSFVKTVLSLNGMYLRYVDQPDVDLQMTAIRQNPLAIQYIEYPAPLLQTIALQKMPIAINWIRPDKTAIDPTLLEKYQDSYYATN